MKPNHSFAIWRALGGLVLCSHLLGCSSAPTGGRAITGDNVLTGAAATGQLPAFPSDRDASVATPLSQDASATYAASPNAQPSGTDLVLPGGGALAHGQYRFATGGNPLISLTVKKQGAPGSYYLGLANYGTQRWEISGPHGNPTNVKPLDVGNYSSGSGFFYCFVATFDGAPVTLQNLTLTIDSTLYAVSGQVTEGGNGLAGVTMALSGDATGTTPTDGQGSYSFSGLADGNYVVTPALTSYTFNPVSANVPVSGADVTGIDFVGTTGGGGYMPDTLYAEPLQPTVATGAPVTVLVTSGTLSNPFQYMSGVGLTIDTDADFVRKSFQFGDVGGDFVDYDAFPAPTWTGPADGIWTAVNPTDFLATPDVFITSFDIGGGRERWDFNITPVSGIDAVAASGSLFNAQFTFATPGTKTFGFQATDGVKRTYYSDSGTEYDWGDIANDGSGGIPNSVVVTGPGGYLPDTLYAEPLQPTANTGAPVMVLVTSGTLPNPFQYMAGCGLTIETDADYVRKTYQYGAVGGDFIDYDDPGGATWTGPADGIWAAVNPADFLVTPDDFITSQDIGGGRERWDLNVIPLGGIDAIGAGGALFNLEFTFATPGVKTFGFQAVSGVKRTYYADSAFEYDWGNIANDGSGGIANSIVIN
jgi:hypothetical protein